jgi:DNA-binding NarL/FixJ family response regulator
MSNGEDRVPTIVVSAHPEGLARDFGLAGHADVVAFAHSAQEVADQITAFKVSVVAVDMALPDSAARATISEIAGADPPVGVVALAAAPLTQDVVAEALGAGAHACATPRTIAEHGSALFATAAERQTFLPDTELRDMLAVAGGDAETTSELRQRRLRNLVLGLVSLSGVLVAVLELLWRQYLGQIGVRPEELDVDAATRLADVFLTISVMVGLIGPLFFVRSWLDLIIAAANDRVAGWLRRHRTISSVALAVVTFTVTVALLQLTQLLFALFFGPFVASLLLAKLFDLDDDLPAVLRIARVRSGRAIASAAVIVAIFLSIVSYEVAVRGPEFDERGEVGWIAPSVLGFNAEPVRVTDLEGETVTEMLLLGSNGDIYVLVDPCDSDRVDYVSAGASQLSVIERVSCT